MSLSEAHTVTLSFGSWLSSRKGEVQRFCYWLPAYWHRRPSLPLYFTLPTDHLVFLCSTRLPTSIFKRTATYPHPLPPFLGITGSQTSAPSLHVQASHWNFLTLFWTTAKRMSSTQEDGIKQQITFFIPLCTSLHACVVCIQKLLYVSTGVEGPDLLGPV